VWYPQLVRPDLGIGPHQVWWISQLAADPQLSATRGAVAKVDARSYARPDPTRTTWRHGSFLPNLPPMPGVVVEQGWNVGQAPGPQPYVTINLTGVKGLTVDIARAGLASMPSSMIAVSSDTGARITLAALPPEVTLTLDGEPTGSTVAVPVGRHQITLKKK
jgi:hypothetical protein